MTGSKEILQLVIFFYFPLMDIIILFTDASTGKIVHAKEPPTWWPEGVPFEDITKSRTKEELVKAANAALKVIEMPSQDTIDDVQVTIYHIFDLIFLFFLT